MPATKPKRPATRDMVVDHQTLDPVSTSRLVDTLARLQAPQVVRAQLDVDLVVGDNRINHNLGRRPLHVTLMPTVTSAAFAWAVTSRDERQVVIAVIGVDQPKASVEVS